MSKRRTYYTLAIQSDGRWSPEFGDYDREVVEQERSDRIDSEECTRRTSKVITTGDTQFEINEAIARLNAC